MLRPQVWLAAFAASAVAHPYLESRQPSNLTEFIASEKNISLAGALKNIGGLNTSNVPGADPGIVVASPSTVNPNYFYTWTRDSALTQLMIIDELIFGTQMVGNDSLQVVVEEYTEAQAQLQTVTNPSGALWPAGLGLGEPKFYTNKTRFNGAWGRPQNDGPALRATTFMEIATAIFERNPNASQIVSEIYWPIILNDLRYVGQYWNTTSYDLWEEVNGNSYFTTSAQHRALVEGALWAEKLNMTCEPCKQAPEILCFLQSNFWNETGGYITADVNVNQVKRSGINADPILGAMHTFDINATCNASSYQPCNSKMLATHKVYVDSFRDLYPINKNATAPNAVAVGRYPEDTYYGGNPWYITTLAAAEFLYDAVAQFKKAGSITIDNTSLPFFTDLYPSAKAQSYNGSDADDIMSAMTTYADGFMAVVQKYTPSNGTLNEQINKTTGEPTSAIALTWSFAAFVTASDRRAGNYPPSWGANNSLANTNLTKCAFSSFNATTRYTPALAAGAKNVTEMCESEVLFECYTVPGADQNVFMVGNTSLLGNTLNNTDDVIQVLRTNNHTATNAEWFNPAWVPAGVPIAYKYVLLNTSSNVYTFENVTRYVTPAACGSGKLITVNDTGSFPV